MLEDEPGYPGMSLHADCQPYGSDLFGPLASVPVSLRVLYYLHELTPERSGGQPRTALNNPVL